MFFYLEKAFDTVDHDLEKAFDTVDHDSFDSKIEVVRFSTFSPDFLRDYLTLRQQYTVTNFDRSDLRKI